MAASASVSTSTISKLATATSDREPASSSLRCCCGLADCLLHRKNCSVLEAVEKDVHTAAQLGQVSRFLPARTIVPSFGFSLVARVVLRSSLHEPASLPSRHKTLTYFVEFFFLLFSVLLLFCSSTLFS